MKYVMSHNVVKSFYQRTIIFSDIDGTFIDENYTLPFSNLFLKSVFMKYDVVFISSRTISEIFQLQKMIDYHAPFIAENGSVIVLPESFNTSWQAHQLKIKDQSFKIIEIGNKATEFKPQLLSIANDLQITLSTMDELSLKEIAAIAGYTITEAHFAKQRLYSIALEAKSIAPETLTVMMNHLEKFSITCSSGGLWHIFTKNTNKGHAVRTFLENIKSKHTTIVGIGNHHNDLSMLKTVDLPFVINNKQSGYCCDPRDLPNAFFLKTQGVWGWAEMIGELAIREL